MKDSGMWQGGSPGQSTQLPLLTIPHRFRGVIHEATKRPLLPARYTPGRRYRAEQGIRLVAIVIDSSEEMRDREEQQLRQLSMANRIAVSGVFHEVRNVCGAMSLMCLTLESYQGLSADRRFRELRRLVEALEQIASVELDANIQQSLEEVPLNHVLDDLRIIIEPAWKEIKGTLRWELPERTPVVVGTRHGLLQAFLNLAKNSHRAVHDRDRRELVVRVSAVKRRVILDFLDSGPGVSEPLRLFQPFHSGAASAGMGLYVSRAILRGYGGELRYETQAHGAWFAVELQAIGEDRRSCGS